MDRRDKTNYYLDMAQVALERGTCLRRNFGAVIVKNDVIVSTGYNGAPRGRANCIDIGTCIRQKMGIPRGERYEFCRSVHAEMNAIIAAPRDQMIRRDAVTWSAAICPPERSCRTQTPARCASASSSMRESKRWLSAVMWIHTTL